MSQNDLMTDLAEIVTDIRRIEYDLNDPMRHCKSELKRLVVNILADAASQARDALLIVERIKYDQARAETDARLIAAAPDLLEALKRCKFDSLNMTLEDCEFCRAAIAKATGEQP